MDKASRADELYAQAVAKEGLYGKAFFGHKKSRREANRLNYLWRRSLKLAEEELHGKRPTAAETAGQLPGTGTSEDKPENFAGGSEEKG